MNTWNYDLIVIGAGSAGSTAAKIAARQGKRVALIEQDKLGGTCLNYGCDPTKALLYMAREMHRGERAVQNAGNFEWYRMNWDRVVDRVQETINTFRGGSHEDAVERQRQRGIDVYLSGASFVDSHTVQTAEAAITGDQVLIATGMAPALPPIDGLAECGFITNREAVTLQPLPGRMAVIGGGFVGVEFAQVFNRFGVEITLFEAAPRILPAADAELTGELEEALRGEGIDLVCGATLERLDRQGETRRVSWEQNGTRHTLDVDQVLVATGRRPCLEALQLDNAGVETSQAGIRVDATLRTTRENIWAAGDVTGYPPFTHVAAPQGKLAVFNAFCREPLQYDGRAIPWAVFTEPALAQVGLTEEQAREQGLDVQVQSLELGDIPRQVITGEREGQIKLLADGDGRLLGAHILAAEAGELIAPAVVALRNELHVEQLADAVYPYPTTVQGVAITAKRFVTEFEARCPDFAQ